MRRMQGHSQEDMLSFGFSTRHWQQIEAGRPITLKTLLRICDVFEVAPEAASWAVHYSSSISGNHPPTEITLSAMMRRLVQHSDDVPVLVIQ